MKTIAGIAGFIIPILIALFMVFCWGASLGMEYRANQAIEAGAAKWVADPVTRNVKLQWITESK